MTGLLVSVRSAAEAEIALAAGVDVIDVKEPLRGSLGAASAEVIASVVEVVAGRTVVSAACGELREFERDCRISMHGVTLAKVALAGCEAIGNWRACWRDWAATLPPATRPVAVVYADHAIARSPRWEDVLALAADTGAPYLLVDTFGKSAGTLFDHWSANELRACADGACAAGIDLVLAGSLSGEAILRACEYQPAYVAVRGAACRGGREGTLDADAIATLLEILGRRGVRATPASSASTISNPARQTPEVPRMPCP